MSITKDLFEFAKRDSDGLYSLSISENGKTETFKRILANDTNNVFSVSKVFTVTAIGFLVDEGLLSLDEKISDIFAAEMPDGYDKKWDSVTVDNVIKHKVGFNEGFLDIDVEDVAGYEQKYGTRTDFLKIVLSHNIYLNPVHSFATAMRRIICFQGWLRKNLESVLMIFLTAGFLFRYVSRRLHGPIARRDFLWAQQDFIYVQMIW